MILVSYGRYIEEHTAGEWRVSVSLSVLSPTRLAQCASCTVYVHDLVQSQCDCYIVHLHDIIVVATEKYIARL